MVFQRDTLLPWLTAEQNIQLSFKLTQPTLRRRRHGNSDWVSELLDMVGLGDYAKLYPYQMSGGMRRRLALLVAIAPKPAVLLLDEPFSALDEPTRVAIQQDVLNLTRRLATTVVLVTHDLAEAITLCDEIVILTRSPGRIAARHTVPYGHDRDALAMRHEPRFLELYGKLWAELGAEMTSRPQAIEVSAE